MLRKEDHICDQNQTVGNSSKMRLMMNSEGGVPADISKNRTRNLEDQKHFSSTSETEGMIYNNNSYNTNTVRVCSDCNTTKTPLWRGGPRGPKSLCNACGIRQRKARRAAAAATANEAQQKDKETSCNNSSLPLKKRCKMTSPTPAAKKEMKKKQQLGFEDLTIILRKISDYQRVFPQDEKEAAILLMALSYGHVHG